MRILKKILIFCLVIVILIFLILYFLIKSSFCFKEKRFKIDHFKQQTALDLINYRIEKDKNNRINRLTSIGTSQKDIDKIMSDLERKYQKERKKVIEYCFSRKKQCKIGAKSYMERIDIEIRYYFDLESISLFNSVNYISHEYVVKNSDVKGKAWFPIKIIGEKLHETYSSCKFDSGNEETSYTYGEMVEYKKVDPNNKKYQKTGERRYIFVERKNK